MTLIKKLKALLEKCYHFLQRYIESALISEQWKGFFQPDVLLRSFVRLVSRDWQFSAIFYQNNDFLFKNQNGGLILSQQIFSLYVRYIDIIYRCYGKALFLP